MRLYLLRHGEAEPYRSDDAGRALVEAGRRAVLDKIEHLEPVDRFLCSPYLRARQTADLVKARVGMDPVLDDRLTPDQPVEAVLALLQAGEAGTTLVVGHNPLLSQLLGELVGERGTAHLHTAGLACLEAGDWFPGGSTLKWLR